MIKVTKSIKRYVALALLLAAVMATGATGAALADNEGNIAAGAGAPTANWVA